MGLAGVACALGATVASPHPRPAEKKASPRKVTYAGDVATILNEKCVSCHRPGEVAPFSLIGYENAKKWSGMLATTTSKGIMPPWKAVHGYGEFRDENSLTPDQIATIAAWSAAGAPRGDAKREPAPPTFPKGEWPLGKPDMIISPTKSFKVDAEGTDLYRNFVIKPNFTQPVWVTAVDFHPGNKKIVHHVITFLDARQQARKLEAKSADGQEGYTSDGGGVGILPTGSLGGWAPGVRPRYTPPGTAFLVKPGTDLILQVHYHKSGKPEEDLTKVGLYFAKEPPQKEMDLHWLFQFAINIPAGEKSHVERSVWTVPFDATIYGAMPHMHLLGKSMKSWLEFPDGTKRPLIHVNDWDFNWQLTYAFKEPIHVPKGTKQIVEAVYDNSESNPRNPNTPPRRVTFGEQTTDEMFLMIVPFTKD